MFSFLRTQPADTPTLRLMKCLHFSGKDLDLNRAGQLGESQKAELHRKFFGFIFTSLLLVPWLGVIASGMVNRIPPEQRTGHPSIYVIAAIMGFLVLSFFYTIYRYRKNVATARIVAFTGRVKKLPHHRRHTIMVINHRDRTERLYQVGFWTYKALLDNETYTVYSPTFELYTVVAAEHIPSKSK